MKIVRIISKEKDKIMKQFEFLGKYNKLCRMSNSAVNFFVA